MTCSHCGGNQFKQISEDKNGEIYQCLYCGRKYDEEGRKLDSEPIAVQEQKPAMQSPIAQATPVKKTKRNVIGGFLILISLIFILGKIFNLVYLSNQRSETQSSSSIWSFDASSYRKQMSNLFKNSSSLAAGAETSSSTHPSSWADSVLNNPNKNVMIAELSLNQDDINLARASVKQYGGKESDSYSKRLDEAQKEHDTLSQKFTTTPAAADVLKSNEQDDFTIVTYYGEGDMFTAYLPDFDQYTEEQVLSMWGEPDEVITDEETIRNHLAPDRDKDGSFKQGSEYWRLFAEEWQTGTMSWRELRAYNVGIYDLYLGGRFSKELVYQNQGKPNVYLDQEGKVVYVTPVLKYLMFPRNGEKYPDKGFKKDYPPSYPENYQFPKGPTDSE